uniref:SSD domain-containing protein n=1 Tax=Parastrongyloides trichosuri TaxID=131310 RepID=A0A0N4ZI90_PARTI
MKRPSSTFVDSGILSGSPVTKLPKLEVDDDKSSMLGVAIKTTEVNLNKIPATPPSANVANGHSRTPTASMDIKSSLSNANTIQNNISISTPQTPLSSKQGMITPGVQTTQGVNNDAMLMEILKANPGFATILPNSAGLHGNLQNTSLSSNQSQHLLNLQQILHHHQALANTAAQRGISNANPSGLFQQQIQMAPSQFMPNISIQNNVGNSSINGMNGQITSSGLSTPSRPPQPANGSQVINKSHCNFSDAHLKICMEINNIKPNPTSNEIPNTTTITSTPISTNSITSISNISSSIGDNKQQTTSVLSNTSTMPGITTGIAPSASNMLPTPGKSVNNVMPTNSNTQNNLTSQQAAMIQAMNAQLQANNGKLNVGNQKPQPVMPGGSVFFNTPPGAGIPNTSVNHQPSLSNSNEVALQQAMMQAVLQANGNIPQIQQQNPILAAQIMALQQQQQNQATNMFLQNVVNAQNSNAANLLGGNNNPMSNNLTTNGDPNKSMLNSKNLLLAQSNEQKQKLMSICTNEILKCTQQMQHYQNLYNTLQIPADKEAAKVEYMKHAAIQAEMNVTLMNIKNQLNTSSQQENLINAQQHQLQAAAMAANNNVRSQLPNNLNIPSSLINNMPVDQFYEMQRQAVAQQHFLRQCQNAAGLQQQYQQQNQINAAVAAVAQNASMFQNQYAQSQLLQMQQLLSAQHQMFKQPNNGNGGAPHNIEQLNRQRSATISGEGPNQNQNGEVPKRAFLLIQAKDGGSMLRRNVLKNVIEIDSRITRIIEKEENNKIDINTNNDYLKNLSACYPLCNLNRPFHLFLKNLIPVLKNGNNKKDDTQENGTLVGGDTSTDILSYPHFKVMGNDIFIGLNLFGVKMSDHIFHNNKSNIKHVDTIILWYVSRSDTPKRIDDFRNITLQLFKEATDNKIKNESNEITFEIYGDEIANYEMVRGAIEATILMIIGFVLLIGFVTFIFYSQIQSKKYVTLLVIGAIASPFLSAISSFGILVWLGYDLYVIMCVTPFMILAIGVDDAFILTSSFVNLSNIKDPKKRILKTITAAGPSITITSLTNTVAFGIGFFTPTKQMSLFCVCTSIAVFLDYIFTYTLFLPILVLIARKECNYETNENKIINRIKYIKKYVKFLCSWIGKVTSILLLIFIFTLSSYYTFNIRQTFVPSKAFPSDSPLLTSLESIRKIFDSNFPVSIFFTNPPNITDITDHKNFYNLIEEIENLEDSHGRNNSLILLDKYEEFDKSTHELYNFLGIVNGNYTPSYHNMKYFLNNILKSERIDYDEKNQKILKLHITLMAKNMSEWSKRAKYYDKIRNILLKYPQFNGTIFDADSSILDMILNVASDLIGSITVSIVSMAIICLFFIPNIIGVIMIIIALTSICYNLVGFLAMWGSDLDLITIVDVLIASGLSVDYTAHIAHYFYASRGNYEERMVKALSEISVPMINAGLSTFLCMFPLIFIQTYTILAFAKTIFIVVGLGLIHGLFILPIMLSLSPLPDHEVNQIDNHQENTKLASIQPFIPKE